MITEFFANRTAAKLARKEAAAAEIKAFIAMNPSTRQSIMARLLVDSAENVAKSLKNVQDKVDRSRTSSKFYA